MRSSAADLDDAIAAHQEAYELVSPSSPHRSGMAGNLAGTPRQAWDKGGDAAALDRSVTLYEEAVARLQHGSHYGPTALANLANGLSDRYWLSEDPSDLDRAVAAATAAVDAVEPGSRDMLRIVDVAAGVLRQRGELRGDVEEVRRAVAMAKAARSATDPQSSSYTSRCTTVSSTLMAISIMTGDLGALDEAVDACRAGLAVARGDQAAPLLGNLSGLLRLRYDLYSDVDDLEQAVRAVELVLERFERAPTPTRAGYLDTAAALLRDFSSGTGDLDALATAEAMTREALDISGPDTGARVRALTQLGRIRRDRWALNTTLRTFGARWNPLSRPQPSWTGASTRTTGSELLTSPRQRPPTSRSPPATRTRSRERTRCWASCARPPSGTSTRSSPSPCAMRVR